MGIECVMCRENFLKNGESCPRVLPCLHQVCLKCLTDEVATVSPGGIITCPYCGFKCSSVKRVPTVFFSNSQVNSDVITAGNLIDKKENQSHPAKDCLPDDEDGVNINGESSDANCQADHCRCFDGFSVNHKAEYKASEHYDYYCTTCDVAICEDCKDERHSDHACIKLLTMLKNKKDYIRELLKQVDEKVTKSKAKLTQIGVVNEHLTQLKQELHKEIEDRAERLVRLVLQRKAALLDEVNQLCESKTEEYREDAKNLNLRIKTFNDSYNFAQKVISEGSDTDLLNFQNDITNRLLQLIHQMKDTSLKMTSLKLDEPERGKEESHLEKLYGSLMLGNISCGDAELLMSFNIDLKWPNSLAVSKSQSIVVTGKCGAFESQGRLMIYDRQGKMQVSHEFEDGCIPNDVVCVPDGSLLVSDNLGRVTKFTPLGKVYQVLRDLFKGSGGRLALTQDSHLVITSLDEKCAFKYDLNGQKVKAVPSYIGQEDSHLLQPNCIAVNTNNDVIIADQSNNTILVFDSNGDFRFRCGQEKFNNNLKCPSSICCDPFNNILVADFTNDSVLLLSSDGEFLGSLVTKDNGVSCPNFISLDHEGHLFVGQYGGEILVFRYLSCIKHA